MNAMTPSEIVAALDRHIIGQQAAKRAVAVAIRNRWRRRQLPEAMGSEVGPKNILMAGPTGVGKTEIARRLAALVNAPFIKVEATKYTEVGYHGRDVETIIRDLLEFAIKMVQSEQTEVVRVGAERAVEDRLLDLLLPGEEPDAVALPEAAARWQRTRDKLRLQLADGSLDSRSVKVRVERKGPQIGLFAGGSMMDQMEPDLQNLLEQVVPSQKSSERTVSVQEARKLLFQEESEKLIDRESVIRMAVERTENAGIVFIDEIDKVVAGDGRNSADVSRQGVQRDLLPIIEGCTVSTRHGPIKTDHILFVAAGAFHSSKPSDLMPELQGRLPIRVELGDLTRDDFKRILTEPDNALVRQNIAMMSTEGVTLNFTDDAIDEMAAIAAEVNRTTENIGARRLHTIMECVLEELSFDAPSRSGETITIDGAAVRGRLGEALRDQDLSRFIL